MIVEKIGADTPAESGRRHGEIRRILESKPYPNFEEDTDPLPLEANKDRQTAHLVKLREYSQDLYITYERIYLRGEVLWENFITPFRPHTIRRWTKGNLIEWIDFQTSRGVHLDVDRAR